MVRPERPAIQLARFPRRACPCSPAAAGNLAAWPLKVCRGGSLVYWWSWTRSDNPLGIAANCQPRCRMFFCSRLPGVSERLSQPAYAHAGDRPCSVATAATVRAEDWPTYQPTPPQRHHLESPVPRWSRGCSSSVPRSGLGPPSRASRDTELRRFHLTMPAVCRGGRPGLLRVLGRRQGLLPRCSDGPGTDEDTGGPVRLAPAVWEGSLRGPTTATPIA
jgi:hypothetical protein